MAEASTRVSRLGRASNLIFTNDSAWNESQLLLRKLYENPEQICDSTCDLISIWRYPQYFVLRILSHGGWIVCMFCELSNFYFPFGKSFNVPMFVLMVVIIIIQLSFEWSIEMAFPWNILMSVSRNCSYGDEVLLRKLLTGKNREK